VKQLDVFVSVAGTANEAQEAFVRAVEDRLRSEGLMPTQSEGIPSAQTRL
jgi:hypothetical protein